MFEGFQNTLINVAKKNGMMQAMHAAHICRLFDKIITDFIPEANVNTAAVKFVDGTLYVKVKSSVWTQELQMKKRSILKVLNSEQSIKTKVLDLKTCT